jgi:aldose 1-epimerase
MADEAPRDGALRPLAQGECIRIGSGALAVEVAPAAGGRLARIAYAGQDWLVGHDDNAAAIAWGCYPMLPWAGRLRGGRFRFEGREYRLPCNLGGHAIHGVGFDVPWRVDARTPRHVELSLALPEDQRWPFGGIARQRIAVSDDALRLELSLTAGARVMPRPVIGWHPWFLQPGRMEFRPQRVYPRDDEGIAVLPLAEPASGPWDDCFVNHEPVWIERGGQRLRMTSDCDHWVIFDAPAHATCVEPQSGPPDGFNLEPAVLAPGAARNAWFLLEWR